MSTTPKTIWVWGDSLTAPHYSWAKQLEKHWEVNMMVHARGGLKLSEVDIPRWATAETPSKWEPDELCVFLGANDGLKGERMETFNEGVARILTRTFVLAAAAGKAGDGLGVTVIMPPSYSYDSELQKKMTPYRAELKEALRPFPEIKATNMPWGDYSQMEDIYHPNEGLHGCWAIHMAQFWGLEVRGK